MKATGIVRRIDDLGRVVIPKEIRRTLRIREGDPLEIFVDREGEVILKKYSPIGELGDFAKEYAEALYETLGHIVCIADRDTIVAVSGASKKDYLDKAINDIVEKTMENRKTLIINRADGNKIEENESFVDNIAGLTSQVISPIIAEGDPIGAVIIASREDSIQIGELEEKMADTAASFLAKQMEQ